MRGGLDETLARLARREEARRRQAAGARALPRPDTRALPGPDSAAESASGSAAEPASGSGVGRNAGPGWPDGRIGGAPSNRAGEPERPEPAGNRPPADDVRSRNPVEEVAEAVRRVVAEHPGLTVTARVEHDGRSYPLRISWSGGTVMVSTEGAPAPPPAWPMSVKTVPAWTPKDGLNADPAGRLAEIIRQDPALLNDDDRQR